MEQLLPISKDCQIDHTINNITIDSAMNVDNKEISVLPAGPITGVVLVWLPVSVEEFAAGRKPSKSFRVTPKGPVSEAQKLSLPGISPFWKKSWIFLFAQLFLRMKEQCCIRC